MDNAAFDRLARLLGGGASRRQALRAVAFAALAWGTAEEIFAAPKKNGRGQGRGKGKGKGKNKNKNKGNGGSGSTGGGQGHCAGTPLEPGQDFLGCDFAGRNLRGEKLHSSSFKDVDLSDADLCGADLHSVSIADSDLRDANLTDVNLDSSSHSKTDFSGADFTGVSLRQSTVSKSSFSGVDFTRADLTGSTFNEVDFSGAVFCRTIRPDGSVDDRDCDACDNACGFCEDCGDEDCAPPTCCADPETGDGVCTDTDTDPDNCGQCGRLCLASTNPCISVECIDGQCVDVAADDGDPCRAQGQDGVCCAAGSTVTCVIGGVCCSSAQCDEGDTCCSGQCVDLDTDPDNCGGCGPEFVCNEGEVCEQGQCVDDECGTDEVRCDGVCTPGVCCAADQTGPQCTEGLTCIAGACIGEGQYRMVLRWEENPRDLDTHVWVPDGAGYYHIFYSNKGSLAQFPFAELDIDDTTSFGPETVTIGQVQQGTYTYAVFLFAGSGTIGTSGAVVELYQGPNLLKTYPVPESPLWTDVNGAYRWWEVFTLGSDGTITDINAPSTNPDPGVANLLNRGGFEMPAKTAPDRPRGRNRGKGKRRGRARR